MPHAYLAKLSPRMLCGNLHMFSDIFSRLENLRVTVMTLTKCQNLKCQKHCSRSDIHYSDIIENYLPLKKKVSNAVHAL